MAYGQTSSGKTFTMGSEHGAGAIYTTSSAGKSRYRMFCTIIARLIYSMRLYDVHFVYISISVPMNDLSAGAEARLGLIPRFMKDIFYHLKSSYSSTNENGNSKNEIADQNCSSSEKDGNAFQVTASFLEVYGEDVHDLLADDNDNDMNNCDSRPVLPLREDGNGKVSVVGLKSIPVHSGKQGNISLTYNYYCHHQT